MWRVVPIALAGLGWACVPSAATEPSGDDDGTSATSVSTTAAGPTSSSTGSTGDPSGAATSEGTTSGSDPTTAETETTGFDTEAGSTDASASTGDDPDPLSIHDDEFDDPDTLADWTFRHEHEGTAPDHSSLDVGETRAGHLTVRPIAGGWFDDTAGFFMWREVTGDFLVEVEISAGALSNPAIPPTRPFNSAGLLVRDPDSTPGSENWVTHNVGYQEDGVATEGKSTVASLSTLELFDGSMAGVLRICRIGSTVVLTRELDGEAEFTQTHVFSRGDFPDTLQVGLAVNGWNSTSDEPNLMVTPDIEARFEYVRFRSIADQTDCLAD
jgi:hypothetical protein